MAKRKSRTKPRRQPLSRDRVLQAALRLVDKAGVESLLRERAISARQGLLRHPGAAVLMESGLNQSPVRLNYGNSVLGLLRDGGFTTPMTYRAFLDPRAAATAG